MTTDVRLSKANKPAEESLRLHPLYRGKIQMLPKCPTRGMEDFAIWHTLGVAASCREIQRERELYPLVAAAVGARAQEDNVARICKTRDELHEQATATIAAARRATELHMKEDIIASPP